MNPITLAVAAPERLRATDDARDQRHRGGPAAFSDGQQPVVLTSA
jgi:hypothetical protein